MTQHNTPTLRDDDRSQAVSLLRILAHQYYFTPVDIAKVAGRSPAAAEQWLRGNLDSCTIGDIRRLRVTAQIMGELKEIYPDQVLARFEVLGMYPEPGRALVDLIRDARFNAALARLVEFRRARLAYLARQARRQPISA